MWNTIRFSTDPIVMKMPLKTKTVFVKDYTRPGEKDSAAGIRQAIQKALEIKATVLEFEAGKYFLRSFVSLKTEGIVHDAGSKGIEPAKDCHLVVQNSAGLTLLGAVNEAGEAETTLAGMNDLKNHGFLPAILWCEDNDSLRLKNIGFTRDPHFASAGKVISKNESSISVEVFEGEDCRDGMGTFCMNRVDPKTGALVGESLTYGNGAGANWRQTGGRTLSLESVRLAGIVGLGDDLSWHQGAQTDFQTYFGRCHDLVLENVRTFNSNGFCMLAEDCHGITAKKLSFAPDGRRLFTGPRDAWKLFKCHGVIEIEEMSIRGVRMDGQNIHANWMALVKRLSPYEVLVSVPYTFAVLKNGSTVEVWKNEDRKDFFLKTWSHEGAGEGGQLYKLTLESALPEGLEVGTLFHAHAWQPDRYTCRNSAFENIAGAGHLIRCDRVLLADNTYRNLMNSGVLLGAELPTHREGGHADDIVVTRNHFENCGFFKRYGTGGGIGINSAGFRGAFNQRITLTDNRFMAIPLAIDVQCARDVWISGNDFNEVAQKLSVDSGTTRNIQTDF